MQDFPNFNRKNFGTSANPVPPMHRVTWPRRGSPGAVEEQAAGLSPVASTGVSNRTYLAGGRHVLAEETRGQDTDGRGVIPFGDGEATSLRIFGHRPTGLHTTRGFAVPGRFGSSRCGGDTEDETVVPLSCFHRTMRLFGSTERSSC